MAYRQRVVVQLKDVDSDEEKETILMDPNTSQISNMLSGLTLQQSDLEAVDNRTLLLTKRNTSFGLRNCQQLRFDCVGSLSDPQTRSEYASLMDQLIVNYTNCCLLRFSVVRDCDVTFLGNLLVREVDRRLQKTHSYMHSIRLDFYDVQKFDVVSLFERAVKLGAPRSKRLLKPRPRNHFNNTLELLKWLQDEYIPLWTVGRGHDILELNFKFSDVKRRIHRVKLALVHMNVNKMDKDTKEAMVYFLQNFASDKKARHTTLTDCLREYFTGPEMWRTWLVFEMPRQRLKNIYIDDMLKLANAAYAGIRAMKSSNGSTNLNLNVNLGELVDKTSSHDKSSSTDKSFLSAKSPDSNALLTSSLDSRGGSTVQNSLLFPPNKDSNQTLRCTMNYSSKELDSLSFWYSRMDCKFAKVIAAMEHYYDSKYGMKIAKIGVDITQLIRSVDKAGTPASLPLVEEKCKYSPQQLRFSQHQYKEALESFRNLSKEIEHSNFGELLRVYLRTKNSELTQHALRFKVQQLESCQSQLSDIISKQVNTLNERQALSAASSASNATCVLRIDAIGGN